MAPFDREGALKRAEKALRQGRVDAAIARYLHIIEAQPRDWNSANALGDLYVRSGQADKGVAQSTRIAEHLARGGLLPQGREPSTRISLKVPPRRRAGPLIQARRPCRPARACSPTPKATLGAMVAERRRAARRQERGAVTRCKIRHRDAGPRDLPARLGAARARARVGDVTPPQLREYPSAVADELERAGAHRRRRSRRYAEDRIVRPRPLRRRHPPRGCSPPTSEQGEFTKAQALGPARTPP